ncbi:hypothetical protein [Nocardiopsis sp. NPDC057823]|uniref:hypothetical protein n=1 Tax=Nocardiopsis sp. NPDC057823 TaxID=3346256 RepID=UPI00366F15EC
MSRVDDELALAAYDRGEDPIEHAVRRAAIEIEVADVVTVGRLTDPAACPGYGATPTSESIARRIVGRMLDIGWEPPPVAGHATGTEG